MKKVFHLLLSKRVLTSVFYVLLISFLVVYISRIDFSALSRMSIGFGVLGVAVIVDLLSRYWTVAIWIVLLKNLGATKLSDKAGLSYVYAKSWLGRYIPGTAPWILGKIYFASQHGISKSKLAVSSLLEAALQIVVMIAFSLLALLIDSRFDVVAKETKYYIAAAFIVCIIALIPRFFNSAVSLAYRILKRKRIDPRDLATSRTILTGAAMYLVGAVLNGLVFFLIAKSVYPPLPFSDILFVMAIGNLSGALGMLAVFVPSGLGVREGVQLILLGLIMPASLAVVITVIARLLSVVTDLLFFGSTIALKRSTTTKS
ncbi:MAG TPA: lysylphosphatidylglycerol synthase domain-containing protein [Candidatus Saccharibacteria bacterium]|nr:lysylphosphatidylglycerol synthase domain-containing protein [Candidatus Saccharibacteria bacterium]HRK93973.1 lysylphosphatidylglycerol synthase domain-containing protein [Candidatus Saccharibacteria bacterium]